MQLPKFFKKLKKEKKSITELYLTLVLDVHYVSAGVWHVDAKGDTEIALFASSGLKQESWEHRTKVVEKILSAIENTVGSRRITKAILGLPSDYLTHDGDIRSEVKDHIKTLTKQLKIRPIGFVSTHQAIIHKLKKDEGVPPSAVLIGLSGNRATVSLYKVGKYIGHKSISTDSFIEDVENSLASFNGDTVLPARLLLYGIDMERLDVLKKRLMKHPWQSKSNFIHFPKIIVLEKNTIPASVSLAGASELRHSHVSDEVPQEDESNESMTVDDEEEDGVEQEEKESQTDKHHDDEREEKDEAIDEQVSENDDNVMLVDPESLGFQDDVDVADEVEDSVDDPKDEEDAEVVDEEVPKQPVSKKRSFPKLKFPFAFPTGIGNVKIAIAAAGVLILFGVMAVAYWLVPRATVTVQVSPHTIEKKETIIVDVEATSIDQDKSTIPGRQREQAVSGEKTVNTTGKKKIGTPAGGVVTIYNKSSSTRSFDKGDELTARSLTFVLDEDVSVASASENLVSGTVTFGKQDVNVTANEIGEEGNISSGTEFSIDGISDNIAVARNDNDFAGGTSKEVSVVSRDDQDALVKSLTNDLVEKAKEELMANVGASETLVDDTIETSVVERTFDKEVGQEGQELTGQITTAVKGISFSESDIQSLFEETLKQEVPENHELDETKTKIDVGDVDVDEDSQQITIDVTIRAVALPTLESEELVKEISGKSTGQAGELLKNKDQVEDVQFDLQMSLWGGRLPANRSNIKIVYEVKL